MSVWQSVFSEEEVRSFRFGTFRIIHIFGELVYKDYLQDYFEFPVGSCMHCRRGAVQKNPFRFKREPAAKYQLFEIGDLIRSNALSIDLFAGFRSCGFRGWNTLPIMNKQGDVISGWEQLIVTDELPQASHLTNWETLDEEYRHCNHCNQETYYAELLVYPQNALNNLNGFARSKEYLGRGLYHPQRIIINNAVINYLLDNVRFTKVDIQPVLTEEEYLGEAAPSNH